MSNSKNTPTRYFYTDTDGMKVDESEPHSDFPLYIKYEDHVKAVNMHQELVELANQIALAEEAGESIPNDILDAAKSLLKKATE